MGDEGLLAGPRLAGNPRHVGFQEQQRVRLGEHRVHVVTQVQRMAGREVHVAALGLGHAYPETFGQVDQQVHGRGVRAARRADDHGVACRGEPARQLADGKDIGMRGRRNGDRLGWPEAVDLLGQDFPRQHQVDRTPRFGHADADGTIQYLLHVAAVAQLVVPLDQLAHHAALVQHLLRPVDLAVAGTTPAVLEQRRAAGGEQHGNLAARRVHDAANGIGCADAHVQHYCLRLLRNHVVAMGHAYGQILVRAQDGSRKIDTRLAGARISLDDGYRVRPGSHVEVFDAALLQQRQVGLAHR